jgi:hypothetical protein
MLQHCARRYRLHQQHSSAQQGGGPGHRAEAYHVRLGFTTKKRS